MNAIKCLITSLFLGSIATYATTGPVVGGFHINSGDSAEVDAYSIKKNVINNHASGLTIYIPLNSSTEWATYVANPPPGVLIEDVSNCPIEYIPVPALPPYTTQNFCVAIYEMRNIGGVATSQAAGNPWSGLSRDEARTQCTNIGGKYDLISNDQWQTIARNIETVPANWSSGTVGIGNLARGWSASTSYGDTYTNTAVAPSTGPTCLYNTAANTCGATGTHLYRRTHTLTNGKEIWDFSGNMWEWTRDNYADLGVSPAITAAWQELSGLSDTNKALFSSAEGTRNSAQGIGQAYGSSSGAVLRSGSWASGAVSGVFAISLNRAPSYRKHLDIGFRCVFVP